MRVCGVLPVAEAGWFAVLKLPNVPVDVPGFERRLFLGLNN